MATTLYRWIPRFVLVGIGVLGWVSWRWIGLGVSLFVGLLVAFIVRLTIYGFLFNRDLKSARHAVSLLSNDELKAIVSDPSSARLGFAMGELERRGIAAVPSLVSVCEMLVSDSANKRGMAMALLGTLYPKVWGRASRQGWSNTDPQEVWRSRLAQLLKEP